MFSPQIVDSDAFLDMSPTAQNLYFHLGMRADDDGFVSNPKKILRMVGGNDDDFKILIAKRFVLAFENGVIVIKHWRINNLVRKDWYKPTQYVEQKSTLFLKENGSYTDDPTQGQKLIDSPVNDSVTKTKRFGNVGKVRLGKVNIIPAEASSVFSLKEEIKKLEDSPRRDLNVIALYLEERKPDLKTKEQLQVAIKRHLRSAKTLAPFSDEQILKGVEKAKRQTPEWTIETITKMLTK